MRTLSTGLLLSLAVLAACASTRETASRDPLTAQVGIFVPPPADQPRARLGVPAFTVADGVEADVSPLAADQLTTLAASTQRFDVVERAQLGKLLDEQGLEGIVKAGELARPAQVRGVEWLLLGKVTSLRVKRTQTGSTFDLGSVPIPGTYGALGLFGLGNRDTVVKVECGVDLRLVDPATGATLVAAFSEVDRTDEASALGLQFLGGRAEADANVQLGADDQGRILRLALDDCMRKLLPRVDDALARRAPRRADTAGAATGSAATATTANAAHATTDATDANGAAADAVAGATASTTSSGAFCTGCGGRLAGGAKFCGTCGTKVQ